MQSFIKRLFECKGTETLEEVMHLKLFGSDFWFIQSVQSAVGCTPLNKQSLSLSGEAPGTELWCSPQSALTEEKQLPPSAEGLHQKPPRGAVRGRSESGQCLWRHLGSAPSLTCSAHSAMLHLHATAPLPLAALLPWKPSPESRGASLPALLIYLETTLLLQWITKETNAPLYNIITIISQCLPQRDSSTSATKVPPH